MQYIPIKTRVMQPPKDDLFAVLDEYLTDVQEGDVVLITSKVASIHLGRCIPQEGVDKQQLTKGEADAYIENGVSKTYPLTIKHHALLYRAGVDEGNSGTYYTLLPDDPYAFAQEVYDYLTKKHTCDNLGVIITDSMVLPFRKGVVSVSIGVAGFVPSRVHDHDQKDLFGDPVIETSTNLADAIAAGSSVVCGEADESTPIVVARDVPNIAFAPDIAVDAYLKDPKEDLYAPLLKMFYTAD